MSTTYSQPRTNHRRFPLLLGARVFLQRGALLRRLAAGEDPALSPELERRMEQLLSARHRRLLAESIERVIDAAEQPPRPYGAAVAVRRAAIQREREALLTLARELRDTDQRVSGHGVALVERLLTYGDSPLYAEGDESLGSAVRWAHGAMFIG